MEDLIGKKLKYKGTNDIKIVKDVKNNVVYFTDNGRIDLSKLNENFDELPSQKINSETFFEPEMNSNFGNLLNQIEQYQNNPSAFAEQSQRERVNDEPISRINGQDVSGISPETLNWMKQQEEDQKKRVLNKDNVKSDPWMQQFADNGGEVKRVDSNYDEQLDYVQKVNNGEVSINTPRNTTNNGLPKMKKTFKIKLKFELSELIPKVEDIRAVENLFEVSLTESLAKEIADKYLNDRELFEGMIISELDKIIKPKKKKPVAKKPVVKKTN